VSVKSDVRGDLAANDVLLPQGGYSFTGIVRLGRIWSTSEPVVGLSESHSAEIRHRLAEFFLRPFLQPGKIKKSLRFNTKLFGQPRDHVERRGGLSPLDVADVFRGQIAILRQPFLRHVTTPTNRANTTAKLSSKLFAGHKKRPCRCESGGRNSDRPTTLLTSPYELHELIVRI